MVSVDTILKALDKYCEFPDVNEEEPENCLSAENYEDFICDPLRDNKAFDVQWEATNGVTKMVIIFDDDTPFVVKIPFQVECDADVSTHFRDVRASVLSKKSVFTSNDYTTYTTYCYGAALFEGPGERDELERNWDYCELEANIWQNANEDGFGECFAKTELVGYVHGYPIYIQTKAQVFENICSSSDTWRKHYTPEQLRRVSSLSEGYCLSKLDEGWLSDFLEYFGEEIFQNFLDYLNTNDIEDLHAGNVGYIDSVPVLIDYAGFTN
jgi:hypothetical protein